METHDVLLEIGTEEVPARLAPEIHSNLEKTAACILEENRVTVKNVTVYGAPRRIALMLQGVGTYQKKMVEEIKGPPENISYDDKGNPTGALEGFMRNKNITEEELEIRETDNGNYIFAVVAREKKRVFELMPEILTEILTNLSLPAVMRWSNRETEFIRPIHWLCALFDDRPVKFEYADFVADRYSRGHRFLAPDRIKIASAKKYFGQLKDNFVLVDPEVRKKEIKKEIKKIEEENTIEVSVDSTLLEEVVHLVEYPTPFLGSFEKKYLDLPDPVLVTPTREHQKYFPVYKPEGGLEAGFVGVRDGGQKHLAKVIEGNEKVLKARFDDAEFYFNKDLQQSNEDRVNSLEGLVFREELGSMKEKVIRIKDLAVFLGEVKEFSTETIEVVRKAAGLCKTDLVSSMVREFPELQGVMGAIYARQEGAADDVCQAIEEHYCPAFADDDLPETAAGKILSLADKLDTLCGCFAVGIIPTGSEDPYGLRRAANGIVRLLVSLQINTPVPKIIQKVLSLYEKQLSENKTAVKKIENFLQERIEYRLNSRQKISSDIITAGLQGNIQGVPRVMELIEFLDKICDEQDFVELVTVYNRIESIVSKFEGKNKINSDLFLEKEEQNLYNIYWQAVKPAAKGADYQFEELYEHFCKLISPVHNFFESVKIMIDDQQLRNNRLQLLSDILGELAKLGRLSAINVE